MRDVIWELRLDVQAKLISRGAEVNHYSRRERAKYACAKGSGELVELIAHGFRRRRELWRLNSVVGQNLPQVGFTTREAARGLDRPPEAHI